MKELFIGCLCFLMISALFILGCNVLTKTSCESTANTLELPWQYTIMTGCIVTLKDGTKVPLDKYRVVE